jgi:hypothetical protein
MENKTEWKLSRELLYAFRDNGKLSLKDVLCIPNSILEKLIKNAIKKNIW